MQMARLLGLAAALWLLMVPLDAQCWAQGTDPSRTGERLAVLPWEYSRLNEEDLPVALSYLRRLSESGFTGIVLNNTAQLALPHRAPQGYVDRLGRLGEEARALNLDVIPMVMNFGDGGALLAHEPNLAEGLPVRDALFVVSQSEARLVPDPSISLENPGFDEVEGNRPRAWHDALGLGAAASPDPHVRHSGSHSLRLDFSAVAHPYGAAWVAQEVQVRPFRLYRLRAWIRTEGLDPQREVKVYVWTGRRHLHYGGMGVQPTQDWRHHDLVFNSLDNERVTLLAGSDSGGASGTAWLDDISIEEIGLLNVIRRPGCPLTVRGEDGTVYQEGIDFEPVADPMFWKLYPWGGFSFSHEPPAIRLTPQSSITEGQRLRVSFYHVAAVYGGQVSLCLSCDRAYELFSEGIEVLEQTLHPDGYHIVVGEIRTANWDQDCACRGLTLADLLVDSIQRQMAIIRQRNPHARVYAWSDMLDPWHNAVDNYYLCNGSWVGAVYRVPRDLLIINWNFEGHEGQSPRFFAQLGFHQLLLGQGPDVKAWLDANPKVPGIIGVCVLDSPTPEDFANAIWGGLPLAGQGERP